jgi:tetratricopeptide (TPR) repeat protein
MPDSQMPQKGAVFLSYASQDAEAARRICDALRATGIVVWFDQSELRGGDAWDQSIRKQIKNCSLFVPVISKHTQTRLEGYFRLEWKLAEDRSHLMAKGKPFIVPVTVDATSDNEAHVPDAFMAVQWTRLPAGETPAVFCERVEQLLRSPGAETGRREPAPGSTIRTSNPSKPSRPWLVPAFACLIACTVLATWHPWSRGDRQAQGVPTVPPVSEARQLVAKAWAQLDKPELGPEELDIADGYCKRAAELDPADAEVWAAWSQVDSWYIYHNFDSSSGRQDAARLAAARALQLAPTSYEARLAQACYLVRGATAGTGRGEVSSFAPEANRLLIKLLEERKDEPRALFALAILQRNLGKLDEAKASFVRLSNDPQYSATAWNELAWMDFRVGSFASADAALARSIAIKPFWANLSLKLIISMIWHGDLASAKAILEELPATVLQSDFGAWISFRVFAYERKPDEWLRFSKGIRRDWIQSNGDTGPIATLNGLAQKMAGRTDAARIEWQTALKLVEHGLADRPADVDLLRSKGELLTYLGDYAGAENALAQAEELSGRQPDHLDLVLKIAEGHLDAVIDKLESPGDFTAAELHLDPIFDPLRSNVRFKSLVAQAEADPKRSPQASRNEATTYLPTHSRN